MRDNGVEAYRRLREIAERFVSIPSRRKKKRRKLPRDNGKEKRDLADEKSPGIVP